MNFNALRDYHDAVAIGGVNVTPSDATEVQFRGLYVGGAGTVAVVMLDGSTPTFTCPAGALLPVACTKVLATGTSATLIVGLL